MPTGYTCHVQDGTVTTFRAYALECARAFGALITMRDEPSDAKIPDSFKAETKYYDEQIARAKNALDELHLLADAECGRRAAADHAAALQRHDERLAEKRIQRKRYEDMKAMAAAWTPPSPDHVEMKKFMIEQLDSSIDFDCSESYMDPPIALSGAEWRTHQIDSAKRDLEYGLKHHREEIERTEGRNRWVRQLRESL